MSAHKMLSALFCLLAVCGYARDDDKTVPGPESNDLRPRVRGYLLMAPDSRQITALELPSGKETIIKPGRPSDPNDDPTIHMLSGPDSEGRIAYIEDHFFVPNDKDRRHLLKMIKLDGTQETELFSRPGDAMWKRKGEIGDHLALSPIGGRVAIISGLKGAQMPRALLQEGSIEIWELTTKTGRKTEIKAIDDGLAWFPDGKRLAFVKLVKPEEGWKEQQEVFFGSTYRGWERVPAVFIRDVESGTESFVAVGWRPVISPDGRSVLVADADPRSYRRIDLEQGKMSGVKWPGAWREPIAWPAEDIALSWCLPTQGREIKYTQNNSPLVGPKLMLSLKLTRFNTNEFETVVPYIDPRHRISFGITDHK